MKEYSFEKLEAWKVSKALAIKIYQLTADFPSEEKFGLVSQMRRAAVSISSNLAEGSGRQSPKDQAHFSQIAFSSSLELLNQLIITKELLFITQSEYENHRTDIEKLNLLIARLRKSQLNRI